MDSEYVQALQKLIEKLEILPFNEALAIKIAFLQGKIIGFLDRERELNAR